MTLGLDILAEVDLARATQILDLSVKVALSCVDGSVFARFDLSG